jgi:hypothetical protein
LWILVLYISYSLLSFLVLNSAIQNVSNKEFLSYRIYTAIECLCFLTFFHFILLNPKAKKALLGFTVLFICISIYDLTQTKAESFDSLPTMVECLILIALSIFYFYEQLTDSSSLFLYNTANFWIIVGVILFFSGSFFVFIYAQNNAHLPSFNKTFKLIMGISSLIENILFLIAFIIAKNESKTIKSDQIASNTKLLQ